MKRRKEDAEKTRELIIDSAISVFKEKGFANATLKEIAENAGLTRGAIYHHFSDKSELFMDMAEMARNELAKVIDEVKKRVPNPVETLKEGINEIVNTFNKDKKMYDLHEVLLRSEVSEKLDFMQDFNDKRMKESCSEISSLVEKGIEQNKIVKHDVEELTKVIVIFFFGLFALSISHPERYNLGKDIKLIDFVYNGILK